MSRRGASPPAESLYAAAVAALPELAGLPHRRLDAGWDCVALDIDDRWLLKFPRHAEASAALRREAALLRIIRPAVTMPVPDLVIVEGPPLFSHHGKIPGEHLQPEDYPRLPMAARDDLAARLALFFAELHALDRETMRAAGALPIRPWRPAAAIEADIRVLLPEPLRPWALATIAAWRRLEPDPLGETYGFFDGHGWNMAFDHGSQRLAGLYDFGDSGFGGLHQEFVYPGWVSPDLMTRVIDRYEPLTGRRIDRRRVHLLAAVLRLAELDAFAADADALGARIDDLAVWQALTAAD